MSEPTHLFVYGTLRPGSGHPMHHALARRAELVGHGWVTGRLYDLGPYPGAVPAERWENGAEDADRKVFGDAYLLKAPEETLPHLDRYEGCGPDQGGDPLFERRQTWVTRSGPDGSADRVRAWIYWYRGPMERATLISSGEWLGRRGGSPGELRVGPWGTSVRR